MIRTATRAALAGSLALSAATHGQAPTFYPRADARPFSEAVQAGDVLYLSGILAEGADGKVVPGGTEAEGRQIMSLLGQVLGRHGLGFDDVIQCTVLLADMNDWPTFNVIYRQSFREGHYPARAALGTTGLALGAKVELQCNAWNPARK